MATITRGATTLTPLDVLGWSLTAAGQSVVHPILGDPEPDVTDRAPGLRSGELRTLWATAAAAEAAAAALSVTGGPWTWSVPAHALTLLAKVTGDITVEAATDTGGAWFVIVGVHEVAP